ncbi:hypothetical protein EB052_01780, partial [bacterium]|nr:hypothetical protein [bacterium]
LTVSRFGTKLMARLCSTSLIWISKKVAERKQSLINTSRSAGFYPLWQITTENDEEVCKLRRQADVFDAIVIVSLIIGLVLLFIFGSANLLMINYQFTK